MKLPNFLAPRLCKIEPDGVASPVGAGGGLPVHVIPRSALTFERVQFVGAGRKAREAARLQVIAKTNESNPRCRIVPDKGEANTAGAWTWSKDGPWSRNGKLTRPFQTPEPLIYEGMIDGVRLITCLEGYSGQVWRDGDLVSDRWWREAPSEQEWRLFLRSGRAELTPATNAARTPISPRIAPAQLSIDMDPENVAEFFNPALVATTMGAVGAFFISIALAQLTVDSIAVAALERQAEQATSDNQVVIAERRHAIAANAQIARIERLAPDASAAEIVQSLMTTMSADRVTFRRLTLRDNRLEFTANATGDVDFAALLSEIESNDLFEDTSIDVEDRTRRFTIRGATPDLLPNVADNVGARR